MSRYSMSSPSVPAIVTVRVSLATSFTISASPRRAMSPMIPSPSWIVSPMTASANEPSATNGRNERAVVLGEEHRARVAGEQGEGALGDPLQHGGRVEHRGDLGGDLGEGGHLGGLALGVAVQPGVLDRDADVRGEGREQALVGLAEAARSGSCPGR